MFALFWSSSVYVKQKSLSFPASEPDSLCNETTLTQKQVRHPWASLCCDMMNWNRFFMFYIFIVINAHKTMSNLFCFMMYRDELFTYETY